MRSTFLVARPGVRGHRVPVLAVATLGRATRVRGRVRADEHGNVEIPSVVTAPTRPTSPRLCSCMNFKTSIKTKLLKLELNLLHYAKEGLVGYQPELKYDTTF